MPDSGCLFVSLICLIAAVMLVLFPRGTMQVSRSLDRTLTILDDYVVKHRYLFSLILFGVSYALFRLALLIGRSQ